MNDTPEPKRPTDHLPPADEREPNDERTTSGKPYPGSDAVEQSTVSPETAAEPDDPDRHGVDRLPSGPR